MECHFDALPCTPFCLFEAFHPQGSVSLDSRVASLPYESSSLATSRGNEKIGGTGYCVTYDTDSQSRNAPCVPFRGRGPQSGEEVDGGNPDYDTRCGRDRGRRHYNTHRPAGDTTTLGPKAVKLKNLKNLRDEVPSTLTPKVCP